MGQIQSHRDLFVWQRAMDLAVEVYRFATAFPPTETYRLTSQITRAAASVPANIAEGHARHGGKVFAHFLAMAKGSLMEVETFVTLATRLGYATPERAAPLYDLITEVSKMLTVLRNKLRQRGSETTPG